jgi:hypothetical protein
VTSSTVLDTIDSKRAVVLSSYTEVSVVGPLAAIYLDGVVGLILVDPMVRLLQAQDYPWGMSLDCTESSSHGPARVGVKGCCRG